MEVAPNCEARATAQDDRRGDGELQGMAQRNLGRHLGNVIIKNKIITKSQRRPVVQSRLLDGDSQWFLVRSLILRRVLSG